MRNILIGISIIAGCLMATLPLQAQWLEVSIINTGGNKMEINSVATVDFTSGANNHWAAMNISWRIPKTAINSPQPTVAPPAPTPEVTDESTGFTGAEPRDLFTGGMDLTMFDLTQFGLPDDGYWYFQVTGTAETVQNIPASGTVELYQFTVPWTWACAACVEILLSDIPGLPISTTSFIDNAEYGDVLRLVTNNAPLPVEFVSFDAKKENATARLSWTVTNEEKVKGYYVQRSSDGTNYTDLDFIPFNTDGQAVHTYHYTDAQPLAGLNYYRIREADIDDKSTYSTVRTLRFDGSRQMLISIYPVPVQQNATLRIESPVAGNAVITLTDLTGRTILQQRTVLFAGVNTTSLAMGNLPAGTYFVQVQHQSQKWIRKIVKD